MALSRLSRVELKAAARGLALAQAELDSRLAGGVPDERYDTLVEVLLDTVDEVEGDGG